MSEIEKNLLKQLKENKTLVRELTIFPLYADNNIDILQYAIEVKMEIKGIAEYTQENYYIKDPHFNRLANALGENVSLLSLNLSSCAFSNARALLFAQTLIKNKHLQSLNFSNNKITSIGAKQLAQALEFNSSLQALDLQGNEIDAAGITAFKTSLANNYSLLTLSGLDHDEQIKSYLERNQTIKSCLSIINQFITNNSLDKTVIQTTLEQLNGYLPSEQNNIYLIELQKLLAGLNWMSQSAAKAINALQCLDYNFTNPALKNAANLAQAKLLFENKALQHASLDAKKARALFILYYLQNHLDEPKLQSFINIALQDLTAQNTDESFVLNSSTQLISFSMLISLAKITLDNLSKNKKNDEFRLLEIIANQQHYSSVTIDYLWKSPAFIQILQQHFPNRDSFLPLEELVHASDSQALPNKLRKLPLKLEDIKQREIHSYSSELRARPLQSNDTIIDKAKEIILAVLESANQDIAEDELYLDHSYFYLDCCITLAALSLATTLLILAVLALPPIGLIAANTTLAVTCGSIGSALLIGTIGWARYNFFNKQEYSAAAQHDTPNPVTPT